MQLTSCSNLNKRIFRGIGRVYRTYLQALRLLANPPLRLIENGATSQLQRHSALPAPGNESVDVSIFLAQRKPEMHFWD
ncbi:MULTISPECIES: hypothetical protein [unclassified Microcoleus]|uniref:hypothetical protein n=1 Tax=unclassified Microcoleus TaxID=2642155 RepID=UPI002FD0CB38